MVYNLISTLDTECVCTSATSSKTTFQGRLGS